MPQQIKRKTPHSHTDTYTLTGIQNENKVKIAA